MKAHPFDAVSMVFGVVFAGIGSLFLMGNDVGSLVTRFWPAAVVLLGLAMLFSARRADEAPVVEGPPTWAAPPRPVAPVVRPASRSPQRRLSWPTRLSRRWCRRRPSFPKRHRRKMRRLPGPPGRAVPPAELGEQPGWRTKGMDGKPKASISTYPDGPLLVRGDYVVKDGSGNEIPARRRTVALCCCGASSIKPWCDGSHKSLETGATCALPRD